MRGEGVLSWVSRRAWTLVPTLHGVHHTGQVEWIGFQDSNCGGFFERKNFEAGRTMNSDWCL
jgi:hypothetical protein